MENFIILASMTEALRAKNILDRYRIPSRVKQIQGSESGRGCTFGLFVPKYIQRAVEILVRYNIHPKGRASGDIL